MFEQLVKGIHSGKAVSIIGKGKSLYNLKKEMIPEGIVIAINHSIKEVEALGLSMPIYSQQKDHYFFAPKGATLLLHKHESAKDKCDYQPRLVFDNLDFGLQVQDFSMLTAIRIAQLMGCNKFYFFCFDAFTNKDYKSTTSEKPNPHYPIQVERAQKYIKELNHLFIQP